MICLTRTCMQYRPGAVLVGVLLLGGCAIQPGVPETQSDSEPAPQRDEIIVVENDVQQDFDNALALLRQEQYQAAIPVLDRVVASEQRLTAPYINLAIAHRRSGDDKKAVENHDKALAIEPFNPVANNEKGLLLRTKGKFDEARAAYSKALEKNPEYLPGIRNLGILCDIYLRDWDCALQQFERYQELSPDDKQVGIWISDLKRRTGG